MDAILLAPRPTVATYQQLAAAVERARTDGGVAAWAAGWLEELAGLHGEELTPPVRAGIARASAHIDRLMRAMDDAPRSLDGAQEALACLHGFDAWSVFERHIDQLGHAGSPAARYEAAADAVVAGDLAALGRLIGDDPGLVRATSDRRHHATLLHYVAANGVEDFRQKTPANIVEVAELLLAAGAEVDARNEDYGGGGTALGLVATSIHPEEAGVQIALMEVLCAAGASVDGLPGSWRPIDAAVANGCPEAAAWLADLGAVVDIVPAAALGRRERVVELLASGPPPRDELEQAFGLACGYGRTSVAELLLDRFPDIAAGTAGPFAWRLASEYGHREVLKMLRARGVAP